jgi:hypothetical protein
MAGRLVLGASGVIRSVSYAGGLITVVLVGGTVLRHRVGARAGIPLAASRSLWRELVALRDDGEFVQFAGRAGWDGWFDSVYEVAFVTEEEYLECLAS